MPRMISKGWLLSFVCLAFLFRLAHFWAITGTAFPQLPFMFSQSDMHASIHWAYAIIDGDWLGRDTYHPYFQWMENMAPLEIWYQWWGGQQIFQQAPFYAYWLAVLFSLSNHSIEFVLIVQLILGALQPLVLYGLAEQLFGERVGLITAGLSAIYGPFIFHQGTVLRDWLPPFVEPLALLWMVKGAESGRTKDWVFSGLTAGLAILIKPSFLVFVPFLVIWLIYRFQRDIKALARVIMAFSFACILIMSPVFIRNAMVGAPIWAISNRAAEGFIQGHASDGFPVGLQNPPSMKQILERSGGDFSRVVLETLRAYEGNWGDYLRLQGVKARALMDPLEVPNNVDFYYGVEISPALEFSLRYGILFPVGVAGVLLAFPKWRTHYPLLLYGLALTIGLMSTIVLARYRLVLVPVLTIYGAYGIVWIWNAWRVRRWAALSGGISLVVAWALIQHIFIPLPILRTAPAIMVHGPEYYHSAQYYVAYHQFDRAVKEMERLRARSLGPPAFPKIVKDTYFRQGEFRLRQAYELFMQGDTQGARHRALEAQQAWAAYLSRVVPRSLIAVFPYELDDPRHAKQLFDYFLLWHPQYSRSYHVNAVKTLFS